MAEPGGSTPLTERRTAGQGPLLVACFGALLAFLDVTIVNVAFPDIRRSFPHTSLSGLSWVLNSYNIVFAAFLVAAGRLADVFGRRRTFALGVALFTVASAWCAAAPSVDVLVAGRVLQAVGAAVLVPASLALVIEASSADRRAHAVSLWGATAAVAAGLGPPVGGALVQAESWRLAFLINVPLGVVALAVSRRILVESRAPGRRTLPDLRGAVLLAVSLALVTFAVVQGPDWGWTSTAVMASFAMAAAVGALFVRSSRAHPVPVLDPRLLRIRSFAVANVVTLVAGMGFYAYMLNNILWLKYVWGYSLLRAGLAVAPGAVVAAVTAAVLGEVADRRSHRLVALPGAVVWAGAYVWYVTQVGTHPAFLTQWLPGQVLSGFGVGATLPVVASAALAAVPGRRYATASAVVSSTRQLGAVLGVALLVVVIGTPTRVSAATAFRHGWVFTIVCCLVAAAATTALRPGTTADVEEEQPDLSTGLVVHPAPTVRRGAALGRSALLSRLPVRAQAQLLDSGESMVVPGGRLLFRAGEPTDAVYVVRAGRLEVSIDGRVVRDLGPGDVVGELGVLTGAPRSADVRARRDSLLVKVTPAGLEDVLAADETVLRTLTTRLAEQLQNSRPGDEPSPAPSVVSLVGAGTGAPVTVVADALVSALSAHVRTFVTRDISSSGLAQAENDHERVVLVADDADDPGWRDFCLRQADRVVVVATSDAQPPEDYATAAAATYVVLVGGSPGRSVRLAWHDAVDPWFVYHCAGGGLPDVADSLAARLAGRSVGIAIAGGGARSVAGLGVLDARAAAGGRVARLSGCCVGAVVAALYATGRDPAAVDAVCYDEFVRRNPFNDYRLPTVSLLRGRKTEAAIARCLGDVHFEELPRELALVSTDLLGRRVVEHRRGRVGTALRASLSLPGLYPPVRIGDSLHVDGGVLDNLPVAPLHARDEGPVVAINIGAAGSLAQRAGQPRVPPLGETLLRTMLMAGTSTLDEARSQAAVVVTPDTRGIGLLEFHQLDRAREAGRVAGQAVVEALADLARGAIPTQRADIDLLDDVARVTPLR